MSSVGENSLELSVRPDAPGVLVAGSNLFAGTLATTLGTHGLATTHTAATATEIAKGLEWSPDLVLIDLRPLSVRAGSVIVLNVQRSGYPVCVIDHAGDGNRPAAWLRAGASAVVGEEEPFDQLLRTVHRLLHIKAPRRVGREPVEAKTETPRGSRLDLFAKLTLREQAVLSELIEGHSAEDIAQAAYVSISTVRSQIKAILQKLGVNSQLAAVAMARRAGWSLEAAAESRARPPRDQAS